MLGGMRLLVVGACALAAAALSGTSSSTAPPALLTYSISYGSLPQPGEQLHGRICLAYPDGAHAVRVLSKGWYEGPAWSPGGRYIAYSRLTTVPERKRLRNRPVYEIFLATARGRVIRNLSKGTSVFNMQPAWSPDGRRLAFTSAYHGSIISVVSRKGGSPYTVAVRASAPTWTPDGTRIVFAGEDGIASVRPDGPPERKLIVPGATAPAISPDGTKLAYIRRTAYGTESDVFVANADGTEERRLTKSPEGESGPTWSPDGSLIAFTRLKLDREDHRWVVVVRSDSGDEYAVIRGPHSAFDPSWRRPVNLPRAKRPPCF